MRIGLFTDYYLPHIGGTETSVFHQRRALQEVGHEVYVITTLMKGADRLDDNAEKTIRIPSWPVTLMSDGMGLYTGNPNSKRILDELQLDIVHSETEFGIGTLAAKHARRHNLPFIYTSHTFLTTQIESLHKYSGALALLALVVQRLQLGRHSPTKVFKPKDGLAGIPCKTKAQKRILNTWMRFASLADVIIAPSKRMESFVGHYQSDIPIYHIPNPLRSKITDEDVSDKAEWPIRFVFAGRLSADKRPNILVEAAALLTPEERKDLQIDIYGGGDLQGSMQDTIDKHQMSDSVSLRGSVDNREVQTALLESDVVVVTSIGFDNQPMTILEGLHASNAILYCDEWLRDGTSKDNALLVAPTPEGFADGLRTMISDTARVTDMKKASKKMAEKYTYEAYVSKYGEILNRLSKND